MTDYRRNQSIFKTPQIQKSIFEDDEDDDNKISIFDDDYSTKSKTKNSKRLPPGLIGSEETTLIDDKKIKKLARQLNNLGVLDDEEDEEDQQQQQPIYTPKHRSRSRETLTENAISTHHNHSNQHNNNNYYDEGINNMNDSHASSSYFSSTTVNNKSPGKSPNILYSSSGIQSDFSSSTPDYKNIFGDYYGHLRDSDVINRAVNNKQIQQPQHHHQQPATLPSDMDIISSLTKLADEQAAAEQKIKDELEKTKTVSEKVLVPSSEHVAEIVGKQGCKIKALRTKTSTYIKTPVRGEEPYFTITGHKIDVDRAVKEIKEAADHFTEIRLQRSKQLALNGTIPFSKINNNENEKLKTDSTGNSSVEKSSQEKIPGPIGPPKDPKNAVDRRSPLGYDMMRSPGQKHYSPVRKEMVPPVFGGISIDDIDPKLLAQQVTQKVSLFLWRLFWQNCTILSKIFKIQFLTSISFFSLLDPRTQQRNRSRRRSPWHYNKKNPDNNSNFHQNTYQR